MANDPMLGTQRFTVGSAIYDIPLNKVDAFKKNFPAATPIEEGKDYEMRGGPADIQGQVEKVRQANMQSGLEQSRSGYGGGIIDRIQSYMDTLTEQARAQEAMPGSSKTGSNLVAGGAQAVKSILDPIKNTVAAIESHPENARANLYAGLAYPIAQMYGAFGAAGKGIEETQIPIVSGAAKGVNWGFQKIGDSWHFVFGNTVVPIAKNVGDFIDQKIGAGQDTVAFKELANLGELATSLPMLKGSDKALFRGYEATPTRPAIPPLAPQIIGLGKDVVTAGTGIAVRGLTTERTPAKLEAKALKPGVKSDVALETQQRPLQTMVEEDIPATYKGYKKAGNIVNDILNERNQRIGAEAGKGTTIDGNQLMRDITTEIRRNRGGTNPMEDAHASILENMRGWIRKQVAKYPDGQIPVDIADAIRHNYEEEAGNWAKKSDSFRESANKMMTNSVLKAMENEMPGIRNTGELARNMIEVENAIARRIGVADKSDLIPYGSIVRGTMTGMVSDRVSVGLLEAALEMTLKNPSVLHAMARLVYKGRQLGLTLPDEGTVIDNIIRGNGEGGIPMLPPSPPTPRGQGPGVEEASFRDLMNPELPPHPPESLPEGKPTQPSTGSNILHEPPEKSTPEGRYTQEAKDLGIAFNGIQKGNAKIPDMPLFTDTKGTGSTFALKPGQTVRQALQEHRAKWGEKGGPTGGFQPKNQLEPVNNQAVNLSSITDEKSFNDAINNLKTNPQALAETYDRVTKLRDRMIYLNDEIIKKFEDEGLNDGSKPIPIDTRVRMAEYVDAQAKHQKYMDLMRRALVTDYDKDLVRGRHLTDLDVDRRASEIAFELQTKDLPETIKNDMRKEYETKSIEHARKMMPDPEDWDKLEFEQRAQMERAKWTPEQGGVMYPLNNPYKGSLPADRARLFGPQDANRPQIIKHPEYKTKFSTEGIENMHAKASATPEEKAYVDEIKQTFYRNSRLAIDYIQQKYPNLLGLVKEIKFYSGDPTDESNTTHYAGVAGNPHIIINVAAEHMKGPWDYVATIMHELKHAHEDWKDPVSHTLDFNESAALQRRGMRYSALPVEKNTAYTEGVAEKAFKEAFKTGKFVPKGLTKEEFTRLKQYRSARSRQSMSLTERRDENTLEEKMRKAYEDYDRSQQ